MSWHQPVTIAKNFSCHSWNADQSRVALSPNNDQIHIFNTNGSPDEMKKWDKTPTILEEHGGVVSAIDWHAETNMIVTSGHDRNAYVWKEEGGVWKPTLVILRINRAATNVKWSPNGKKFAVSSGAKCVPVCSYEQANDWWISKMIKKHKSTVLSIAWSPCNKFLVTGSTDFKCRIFSAFIADVDEGYEGAWPKAESFGSVLAEFDQAKAWVQGVAWSGDSSTVVFNGHGSTTHFVDLDDNNPKDSVVSTVYSKHLPHLTADFMSDTQLVCCGFDMNPHLYVKDGGEWSFSKKLDEEKEAEAKSGKSDTARARNKFKNMAKKGQSKSTETKINTRHKNTILDTKKINDTTFSSCGVDGRILIWNM